MIMFAVLYLTHGLSARTSTAVIGTLVSLALIGVLGAAFSAAARLTGLDDQTNALITSLGTGVDARGLLLAGMVIGALGVLDDVTVTQTSAVWELHAANPRLGTSGLFRSAMRIGRDHVASAVNTLVLAYAGAALPLLLLFQLSRPEPRRGRDQPGRRDGDRPDAGGQHRARGVGADHDGGRGAGGEPGGAAGPSLRRTTRGPGEERRLTVALAVEQHVQASERCSQLSRRCPEGAGPAPHCESTVTASRPPGASTAARSP